MSISRSFDKVVLAAPVSCGYARYSTQPAGWYVAQCLRELIAVSGIPKPGIEGLSVSSFTLAPDPVASLSRSLGCEFTWLESVPFGGASGVMALRRAARAVQAGDADVVACIGADSNPRDAFENLIRQFSTASTDAVFPLGAGGPSMPFAHVTRQYMDATGTTSEDFAHLCVSQRLNAGQCAHALLREPISVEQYLDSPLIADPLRKLDLVMPCCGADGFLVMSEDRARRLRIPFARIRGSIERHNAYADDVAISRGGWARDADRLYTQAGIAPEDVDVLATYDDCPAIVFMQLEGLAFCAPGEAARFVRTHKLTFDGDFPLNTSGGQLGCGQAGAAGGFLGLVEVLRQLTGQAYGRQVARARCGVVGGYGMAVYDRCLATSAVILEGSSSP